MESIYKKNFSEYTSHTFWMQYALRLAHKAKGWVSPNPAVGAVLVKNNEIISTGWTQPPGSDHAERMAIKRAGKAASSAILYTTLEPCCHYGRTPPCTDLIIESGISQVVIGCEDPNPLVHGNGIRQLQESGIQVIPSVLSKKISWFYRDFFYWIKHRLPYVIGKFAMSWDGKIAAPSGDSKWITNLHARKKAHQLRHACDAILVGAQTVITDNPSLTVRHIKGKNPLRVILDPTLRCPLNSKIFSDDQPTLIITKTKPDTAYENSIRNGNNTLFIENSPDKYMDWNQVLTELANRNICSLLIEGGGKTLGLALQNKIIHEVVGFISPLLIGGANPFTPFQADIGETMDQAYAVTPISIKTLDQDIQVRGLINYA